MAGKPMAFEEKFDAHINELIEYYKSIEGLQFKQDTSGIKLHVLRSADDEAWEDLKTGAETAWDELMSAFHTATAKFK